MPKFVDKQTGQTYEFTGAAADWAASNPQYEPEGGLVETSLGGSRALLPQEAAEFRSGEAGGNLGPAEQLSGERTAFGEEMHGSLGQEVLTGLEGVASGLSLGGSDVLLDLLGAETAERAEVNPYVRTGGEIAGMIAPAVLTGGLAATPAGIAMGAGRAAESAVGGVAGRALGGVVEGAIFGAGQGVSNLALSNAPVTASAVVEELGMNALLGGGLGGVLGGVTAGLGKAGRKIAGAVKRTDEAIGGELGATVQEARNLAADAIEALPAPGKVARQTALDLDSDLGRAFAAKTAVSTRDISTAADELLTLGTDIGTLKGMGDDLLERAVMSGDKSLVPEIRKLRGAYAGVTDVAGESGIAKYAEAVQALGRRLGNDIPLPGLTPATAEVRAGRDAFRKAWGIEGSDVLDQTALKRFAEAPLESQVAAVDAFQSYQKGLTKLAGEGNPLLERLALNLDELKGITADALPEAAAGMTSAELISTLGLAGGAELALPNFDGPFDDLLKMAIAYKVVRRGGLARAVGEAGALKPLVGREASLASDVLTRDLVKQPAQAKPAARTLLGRLRRGRFPEFVNRSARAFGLRAGRRVGGSGIGGIATGAVGSVAGDMFMRGVARAVLGTERLAGVTGSALSRIGRLTGTVGTGAERAGRHGAGAALAVMNAMDLGGGSADTLQEAYRLRAEELSAIFANPQASQQAVHDSLTSVRDAHMGVGDKLEMWMYRAFDYLYKTMPRDPGTMHVLGKSTWQPDDLSIAEWASRMFGVDAPIEAMERTMSGEINPAAVEAVRTVHPELFAEVQTAVMENLDTLLENSTFDQRNALGSLLGVPTDSALEPEYTQFVKTFWAQRTAAAEQASAGANPGASAGASSTEAYTHAQQLQLR